MSSSTRAVIRENMSAAQPDNEHCIQDFHQWANGPHCKGTLGPISEVNALFLLDSQVKNYLNVSRVGRILEALLQAESHTVEASVVSEKYAKIFAILLSIGKWKFIDHFVQHDGLCDEKLPFGKSPPSAFPVDTSDKRFFEHFREMQWRFCVPTLAGKMNSTFESQRVLPIIHKEILRESTSAVLYKITLHEAYNKLHGSNSGTMVSRCLQNLREGSQYSQLS